MSEPIVIAVAALGTLALLYGSVRWSRLLLGVNETPKPRPVPPAPAPPESPYRTPGAAGAEVPETDAERVFRTVQDQHERVELLSKLMATSRSGAVTPELALRTATARERGRIDELLQAGTFSVPFPTSVGVEVLAALQEHYRKLGWTVEDDLAGSAYGTRHLQFRMGGRWQKAGESK